jgi:hypothetical protein
VPDIILCNRTRLGELLQTFGCADVIAPMNAEEFGRRAGELIARGTSTSRPPRSLRASTVETGTHRALPDIRAVFAIPCFGVGVLFAIAAATFFTNLEAREAAVFAAIFWLAAFLLVQRQPTT